MSGHSLFAPSASSRWIPCPGSMAFKENQEQGGSSTYADDGTATHMWAAAWLEGGKPIDIGSFTTINGKEYTLDEERADRIQRYVADVRRRAIGGQLFVEQRVDLSYWLGAEQGGTADAVIVLPEQRLGIVEDLKDGSGEKVYASYCVKLATDTTPEVREPNPQLALYALGMLPNFELFGEIDELELVIFQPKLDHVDTFKISVADLQEFGAKAASAVLMGRAAMASGPAGLTTAGYFNPGKFQCRWCRATTKCPALKKFVADETLSDLEDMTAAPPMTNVPDTQRLARMYAAVPLIKQWCADIEAEVVKLVTEGTEVIGPDGKPYKFVEGKEGARKWTNEEEAQTALAGQLPIEKYLQPAKVITAPQAAKLLDKKATKALWTDIFEPLIARPRGKPILTLGSDTRPPLSGCTATDDLEDELQR